MGSDERWVQTCPERRYGTLRWSELEESKTLVVQQVEQPMGISSKVAGNAPRLKTVKCDFWFVFGPGIGRSHHGVLGIHVHSGSAHEIPFRIGFVEWVHTTLSRTGHVTFRTPTFVGIFKEAFHVKINATNVTETGHKDDARDKLITQVGRGSKKRHELHSQFVRGDKISPGIDLNVLFGQFSGRDISTSIIDQYVKSIVVSLSGLNLLDPSRSRNSSIQIIQIKQHVV